MPEIGRVLGGRYRLVELIGEGGMATIYRAHDTQLGRDVAVKLLRPEYGRDAAFGARFRQEAQAAASLSHPNVASVYDYGTDEAGPFIVMELVDGQDLATILRQRGALPPQAAARIALGIADALAAAHARGIIHRDIKPSNVLVTTSGQVRVVDFGIARALSEAQLTLPGTTLGSVHYFSPEQARGEAVTTSSDVYSLGLVLFEMLTGQRPFGGDSAAAVAMARLTSEVPPPSSLRSDVPPALDAIVRRATALDPATRFGSAAAMSDALGQFLSGTSRPLPADGAPTVVGRAAAVPGAAAVGAADATLASPPEAAARGIRSGPAAAPRPAGRPPGPVAEDDELDDDGRPSSAWAWAAGILGIVVLVAAAALAFVFFQGLGRPGPSPSGGQVAVPKLVDLPFDQAKALAQQAGFQVVISGSQNDSGQAPNTVLSQVPAADTMAAAGGTINVTIATGSGTVPVPDVRGQLEAQAVAAIQDVGLRVGQRSEAYDPLYPAGSVISTSPAALVQVAPGQAVDYVVSKGPEPTASPTPSPSPSPSPTPSPTPAPTPSPTPPPTPTPSPTQAPTPTPNPSPTV